MILDTPIPFLAAAQSPAHIEEGKMYFSLLARSSGDESEARLDAREARLDAREARLDAREARLDAHSLVRKRARCEA